MTDRTQGLSENELFECEFFQQNKEKFKELVVLICNCCEKSVHFGLTKLNKILFVIDFDSYARRGKPVTGARYKKETFGPVPFSISHILRELQDSNVISIRNESVGQRTQSRLIASRDANRSVFDREELEIIESWISETKDKQAKYLSDWSHKLALWDLHDENGFIPYGRVNWRVDQPDELSQEERQELEAIKQSMAAHAHLSDAT